MNGNEQVRGAKEASVSMAPPHHHTVVRASAWFQALTRAARGYKLGARPLRKALRYAGR